MADEIETSGEENPGLFRRLGIGATMPATIAQQVFSIVPGIAGGAAGFVLATKLAKVKKVKTKGVVVASVAVAALTFAAIYLIVADDDELMEGS